MAEAAAKHAALLSKYRIKPEIYTTVDGQIVVEDEIVFYVLHYSNNFNTVTCTFTGFTEFVLAADQRVNIFPCLARAPLGLLQP